MIVNAIAIAPPRRLPTLTARAKRDGTITTSRTIRPARRGLTRPLIIATKAMPEMTLITPPRDKDTKTLMAISTPANP